MNRTMAVVPLLDVPGPVDLCINAGIDLVPPKIAVELGKISPGIKSLAHFAVKLNVNLRDLIPDYPKRVDSERP